MNATAKPTKPGKVGPASAFLRSELGALESKLDGAAIRVLARTVDGEAIHDLRVILRKIRTLLKIARPIYGRFHADAVRKSFSGVAELTGVLRDEEVLLDLAKKFPVLKTKRAAWIAQRRRREATLRGRIKRILQTGVLEQARALLRALILLPALPKRDVDAGTLARRAVKAAAREVRGHGKPAPDAIEALHDLRIAHKHLRYACELFHGALVPYEPYVPIVERSVRFQKRLGNVHDADVAKIAISRARTFTVAERAAIAAHLDAFRAEELAKLTTEPPKSAATSLR